jgi:hypothetical protein
MKKIVLIIVAIFLATIALTLVVKGVCMPFLFWGALITPIAYSLNGLGIFKNMFK